MTYKQTHLNELTSILINAAQGVSSVTGSKFPVSDMVYSVGELRKVINNADVPFYIAIRMQGTECGNKKHCIERCSVLGYPLVIAKIESDKVCDYNMTINFTQAWASADIDRMKVEFDSI